MWCTGVSKSQKRSSLPNLIPGSNLRNIVFYKSLPTRTKSIQNVNKHKVLTLKIEK